MILIGCDPGLGGSIGVLKDGQFYGCYDMPTVVKSTGRKEINPAELYRIIRGCLDPRDDYSAILEQVSARPNQGGSGVFSFGDSFGGARACLLIACHDLNLVTPKTWKGYLKLGSDKEESRAMAIKLFPEAPLSLKKHEGRAEALLLAYYLWSINYK